MQPNSNNSSVNKKLLNLDIIRAVAAVMIVLVHLELFGWGGHGVELFLLLTGYTAFLSIDRHKDVSPLSYYKRRLARILPSYYGVVLIYFFIYLVVLGERYPAKQIVVSLVKYFTLTTTFFPRDLLFWFYLGTTGTIVTIMLFYIIAPFYQQFQAFGDCPHCCVCCMPGMGAFPWDIVCWHGVCGETSGILYIPVLLRCVGVLCCQGEEDI